MPIRKQTKDNYPNKLTDCQKQTKNPHFYLVGGKQNKTKTTKQNKNKRKIKALLFPYFV